MSGIFLLLLAFCLESIWFLITTDLILYLQQAGKVLADRFPWCWTKCHELLVESLAPKGNAGSVQAFRKGKPHVFRVVSVIDVDTIGCTASVEYNPSSIFFPLLEVTPSGSCINCSCSLTVDSTRREWGKLLTALGDVSSFNGEQETTNIVLPGGVV